MAVGFYVLGNCQDGFYAIDVYDSAQVRSDQIVCEVWVEEPEYRNLWLQEFDEFQRLLAGDLSEQMKARWMGEKYKRYQVARPEQAPQPVENSISPIVLDALNEAPLIMELVGPVRVGRVLSYTESVLRYCEFASRYFWAVDVTFQRPNGNKTLILRVFLAKTTTKSTYYSACVSQILYNEVDYVWFEQNQNWVRLQADVDDISTLYADYFL